MAKPMDVPQPAPKRAGPTETFAVFTVDQGKVGAVVWHYAKGTEKQQTQIRSHLFIYVVEMLGDDGQYHEVGTFEVIPWGPNQVGALRLRYDHGDTGPAAEALRQVCDQLKGAMQTQGFELATEATKSRTGINLGIGAPGAPRDELYNKAFNLIQGGMDAKKAFEWFCEEADIKKPDKSARDAFRAAMKRRHKDT